MFGFMPLRFRPEEGGGPNVNTGVGFTKALVAASGGELTEEQAAALAAEPDRSVASGLTSESDDVVPVGVPTPVAEDDDQGAAPPVAEPATPAEPTLEERLSKQLEDSQRYIGEQGNRIGQMEAELRQLREEREADDEIAYTPPTSDDETRIEEMMDEIGGPATLARLSTDSPHLIDTALDIWYENDPRTARRYEREVNRLLEAEGSGVAAPAAPQLPPEVQSLVARERMTKTFGELSASIPAEKRALIATHLDAAVNEAGPLTKQAINDAFASNDQERFKAAFDEVVALAEARAGRVAAPVAQDQRRAASVEAKRKAQVATGSQGRVPTGQAGELPASKDEYEAIKQADPKRAAQLRTALIMKSFEDTETTSVAEGLKQGRGN